MKMQATRRQHYVPKFYLENFSEDGKHLWCYDKESNKIYRSNISDICVKNFLYETKWKEYKSENKFVNLNAIEKDFAKHEGEYAELIRKIISICILPENKNALILNTNDKHICAHFAANMLLRNPWSMNRYSEDLESIMELGELQPYKEVVDFIKMGDFPSLVDAANKQIIVGENLEESLPNQLKEMLYNMNITIWEAPKENPLITSSFPVIYQTEDLEENNTSFKYLYIPINPRFAISYSRIKYPNCSNRLRKLTASQVHSLNNTYIKSDDNQVRLVLAGNQEVLIKLKNSTF